MVASQSRSSFSPSFRAWLAIHVFSVSQRVSDHPPSRPSNYSCVRRHIHGNIVQGEIRIVRSRARPSCRQQNAALVVGGWWKVEGLLLLSTAADGRTLNFAVVHSMWDSLALGDNRLTRSMTSQQGQGKRKSEEMISTRNGTRKGRSRTRGRIMCICSSGGDGAATHILEMRGSKAEARETVTVLCQG